eukprot:scaffold17337_cov98-Isochrysis_galbana.AAC.7
MSLGHAALAAWPAACGRRAACPEEPAVQGGAGQWACRMGDGQIYKCGRGVLARDVALLPQ